MRETICVTGEGWGGGESGRRDLPLRGMRGLTQHSLGSERRQSQILPEPSRGARKRGSEGTAGTPRRRRPRLGRREGDRDEQKEAIGKGEEEGRREEG